MLAVITMGIPSVFAALASRTAFRKDASEAMFLINSKWLRHCRQSPFASSSTSAAIMSSRARRPWVAAGNVKPIDPSLFDEQNRKPQLPSRDERAPLDERGRASLFVNLAGHEMTFLVEMIVDLRMN